LSDVLTRLSMVQQVAEDNRVRIPAILDPGGTSPNAVIESILMDCSRRVHQEGRWVFNRRLKLTLSPDGVTGKISVPSGCLFIDTADVDEDKDIVQRGEVLYDRENDTEVFTKDVVVIVKNLYLPECADPHIRDYILADAAMAYCNFRRDDERLPFLAARRESAKRRAYGEELDKLDVNMLRSTDGRQFHGTVPTRRPRLWSNDT
jgi:hypothetical protein